MKYFFRYKIPQDQFLDYIYTETKKDEIHLIISLKTYRIQTKPNNKKLTLLSLKPFFMMNPPKTNLTSFKLDSSQYLINSSQTTHHTQKYLNQLEIFIFKTNV